MGIHVRTDYDCTDGRMRAFELGATIIWEKSRLSQHLARMAKPGLLGPVSGPWVRGWVPACE